MLRFIACLAAILAFTATTTYARDFVDYTPKALAEAKKRTFTGKLTSSERSTYNTIIRNADKALAAPLESVTLKAIMPPSRDKHDYLSISRYWWPNDNSANGLPWVQKDGETNPITQSDQVDRGRLGRVTDMVRQLSLAYYFTQKRAYAEKAAALINTWFLDPKTRMNPNLNYSQLVPGKKGGRRAGVLDGRLFAMNILDSSILLEKSKFWNKKQQDALNGWFTQYLTWLTQSRLGRKASENTNNHGSWYQYQAAAIAYYLGDMDTVKNCINNAKDLIDDQILPSGEQPQELKRTRSFFYSSFNLDALTRMARLSQKAGDNLWTYKSPNGSTLLTAIDYMAIYATGEVKWPHASPGVELALMPFIFIRAEQALNKPRYKKQLAINPYQPTTYGHVGGKQESADVERFLSNYK